MRYCNNNNNNNSNNNNKNNNKNLNDESRGHIFSNKYCLYWLSNNKNNRQILIRDWTAKNSWFSHSLVLLQPKKTGNTIFLSLIFDIRVRFYHLLRLFFSNLLFSSPPAMVWPYIPILPPSYAWTLAACQVLNRFLRFCRFLLSLDKAAISQMF